MNATAAATEDQPALTRGIGSWQATALNITFVVGAGVFGTIPLMLKELPGPYALLGWLTAGVLIFFDGLIWSELGAAMPGSGGSYRYLLECYGRERWGRLMAFLFIWQFLISGPLELGSGLAFLAQFATGLSPEFKRFNDEHTTQRVLWEAQELAVVFSPARLLAVAVGVGVIVLLYRNITTLGRLTMTLWIGVLAIIGWILVEGGLRFESERVFDFSAEAAERPDLTWKLGAVMILAIYSYLGYYNVCYVGDEVRDAGRTIPRSIKRSVIIVCVLFVGLHLAMLGTVSWRDVPRARPALDEFSLPAEFMRQIHGDWAATVISILLLWSCFGSVFAGMLGYSRIPYGAARNGHFFALFARVHPQKRIPHFSLLLVGGLTLLWSFFDLTSIINALITTRILEQFIGQVVGVVLLRRHQPERFRPYKMWLYPLPCFLALAGWLYVYLSSPQWLYIALGIGTLLVGVGAFLLWAKRVGGWPFAETKTETVGA